MLKSGRRRPFALVLIGIGAALTLAIAGCTGTPNPNASSSPSASASSTTSPKVTATATGSASAAATPAQNDLQVLPLAGVVEKAPVWKDGTDPAAFGVQSLQYVQWLATKAGLPVKQVNYAVKAPGKPVECDSTRKPSTIDGTLQGSYGYGIMWCPVPKLLVVVPTVVAKMAEDPILQGLAKAFYADALVWASANGKPGNENLPSCYHGVMSRQQVAEGQSGIDETGRQLYGFYDGSDTTGAVLGFTRGRCS